MSQPAFDFGDDELDDAANPTYSVGELADAINDGTIPPAFVSSPYGVLASAVVLTTSPEGKSGLLCTEPN